MRFYVISQHGTRNVKTHNRTTRKIKKYEQNGPLRKPQVNSGEGQAVSASYKTPAVLLIYTV